jgi:hypothetical protein
MWLYIQTFFFLCSICGPGAVFNRFYHQPGFLFTVGYRNHFGFLKKLKMQVCFCKKTRRACLFAIGLASNRRSLPPQEAHFLKFGPRREQNESDEGRAANIHRE